MKIALMIMGAISIYFGFMLITYMLIMKVDKMEGEPDPGADGASKAMAFFWPLGLPIVLFVLASYAISKFFDLIRETVTRDWRKINKP